MPQASVMIEFLDGGKSRNKTATLLRHFLERQFCLLHGVVARGRATISGGLDSSRRCGRATFRLR
jgi:hypothetical protein